MDRTKLNYLPVRAESKAPAVDWKQYQTEKYAGPLGARVGVVCGESSNRLEIIDFDDGGSCFEPFINILKVVDQELFNKLHIHKTPHGFHIAYYSPSCGKNTKLAEKEDGAVLIETRGQGGFCVVPPTPGYSDIQKTLEEAPELSGAERARLFAVAESFNRKTKVDIYKSRSNNEDGPAELLRRPEYREEVAAALSSMGFIQLYENESGVFYGNREANNPRDVKALLSSTENFVYCFGSNHIGQLCSGGNTPLYVIAAARGVDLSTAARSYLPQRSGSASQAPTQESKSQARAKEPKKEESERTNFYKKYYSALPAFIRRVVDRYNKAVSSPQNNLYCFNLFTVAAFLLKGKVRVNGEKTNIIFNTLNISETASGKDAVRTRIKRLIIEPLLKEYEEEKARFRSGDEKKNTPPPSFLIEDISSKQAIDYALATTALYDMLRKEAEEARKAETNGTPPKKITQGVGRLFLDVDEVSDLFQDRGVVNLGAKARIKTLLESSPQETITIGDGIRQRQRLAADGLPLILGGSLVGAAFFAPLDFVKYVKESEIVGGFINRLNVVLGEPAKEVLKVAAFAPHKPDYLSEEEQSFSTTTAKIKGVDFVVSPELVDYATGRLEDFFYNRLNNGNEYAQSATRRILARFTSICCLLAWFNNWEEFKINSYSAANEFTFKNDFAEFEEADVLEELANSSKTINIKKEDIELAIIIMEYFRENMQALINNTTDETASDAAKNRIKADAAVIRYMKKAKGPRALGTIYYDKELRRLAVSRAVLSGILETLVASGELIKWETEKGVKYQYNEVEDDENA